MEESLSESPRITFETCCTLADYILELGSTQNETYLYTREGYELAVGNSSFGPSDYSLTTPAKKTFFFGKEGVNTQCNTSDASPDELFSLLVSLANSININIEELDLTPKIELSLLRRWYAALLKIAGQ